MASLHCYSEHGQGIMKTNALVDNILTEKSDLDTQMAAIQAMGGQVAFQEACKSHAGLRKAIANQLADTKKKRAKQFETIRSMRRVMQTLVAEIDDANTVRQDIRQSIYSNMGTNKNHTVFRYCDKSRKLNRKCLPLSFAGPNPRSLLRPEINRNLNHIPALPQPNTPSPSAIITPPTTPANVRLDQKPKNIPYTHFRTNNNSIPPNLPFFRRINAPRQGDIIPTPTTSASPTFSSDDDESVASMPMLQDLISPISSPGRPSSREQETEITQSARYCNTCLHTHEVVGRLYALRPQPFFSLSCSNSMATGYRYQLNSKNLTSQGATLRGSTPRIIDRTQLSYYNTDTKANSKWYGRDGLGTMVHVGSLAASLGYLPFIGTDRGLDRLRYIMQHLDK